MLIDDEREIVGMRRTIWIIVILAVFLILAASLMFYRSLYKTGQSTPVNNVDFAKNLVMPDSITLTDKVNKPLVQGSNLREGEIAIDDKVVIKTIFIEVGKSPLTSVAKTDKEGISDTERAFSIGMIYAQDAPKSNRLTTIEVLQDGTFITSKVMNGKEEYVKGKFGKYTMDYLVGLYTIR